MAPVVDIAHRLEQAERGLLSDEGLRRFYREDVAELLKEVLTARRALEIFKALPIEHTSDYVELAQRIFVLWKGQTEGFWEKAEVVRLRERTAVAERAARQAEHDRKDAEQAREQAEASASEARAAMLEARQARAEAERTSATIIERAAEAREHLVEASALLPNGKEAH